MGDQAKAAKKSRYGEYEKAGILLKGVSFYGRAYAERAQDREVWMLIICDKNWNPWPEKVNAIKDGIIKPEAFVPPSSYPCNVPYVTDASWGLPDVAGPSGNYVQRWDHDMAEVTEVHGDNRRLTASEILRRHRLATPYRDPVALTRLIEEIQLADKK